MTLLFCGIALGFVLSFVLMVNRLWRMEDKMEYYRAKAKVYERTIKAERKDRMEWAKINAERTAR